MKRAVARANPRDLDGLEKAVQLINRAIAAGEQAKWGSNGSNGGNGSSDASPDAPSSTSPQQQQQAERWVQFGAVYNSSLLVDQPAPSSGSGSGSRGSGSGGGAANGGGAPSSSGRSLRDYLALPLDEYSLLDPKWIAREEGGSFRFSLPLQDLVGVDLQPEISFSVTPEPAQQRVTLQGSRAALGAPEIDSAFRLSVAAVLSQRQRRRLLPRPPDHLPGRPVYRLRRWAAAARGRTWPPPEPEAAAAAAAAASWVEAQQQAEQAQQQQPWCGSSGGGIDSVSSIDLPEEEEAAGGLAAAAAAADADAPLTVAEASSVAPFPQQKVYISHDGADSDEYDLTADSEEEEAAAAAATATATAAATAAAAAVVPAGNGGGNPAVLHCRTHITMAVLVPRPLRVVPNALLGYAGSLLLRAVLSATLPNFLQLLAADYRRWSGLAGAGSSDARRLDAPVGELFSDAAAAVQSGRERRRQEAEADAEAARAGGPADAPPS